MNGSNEAFSMEEIRKDFEIILKLIDTSTEKVIKSIRENEKKIKEESNGVTKTLERDTNILNEIRTYFNVMSETCVKIIKVKLGKLDISGEDELRPQEIPVPSNITTKSSTWDSITLAWDEVSGASFYQIEVDGSILPDMPPQNTFTVSGLLPETEHNFKVRTVGKSSVSDWSDVEEERTLKWKCAWEECPSYVVDKNMKYIVNGGNHRVATKDKGEGFCTIIGNTPIPLNTTASWCVKVCKSMKNDGKGIYIGVAQNDINQSIYNRCRSGWYFHCYGSKLRSGPPHNYDYRKYGPHKGKGSSGQYVHTGDSVGVVMDTANGELSFVLGGENHGVAYKEIPLDKPLVPCVLLYYKGDSVELGLSKPKYSY